MDAWRLSYYLSMLKSENFHKSEYWRNLYAYLKKSSEPSEINRVIEDISSLSILEPSSDILRLTFLSEFYNRDDHVRLAGIRAANSTSLSIEALSAFASLYCIAPLKLENKNLFSSAIMNAQLPKIISKLNKAALKHIQGKMNVRISQKIDRISILTSYFGNTFHTPSMLAVNYASVLSKLGVKVNIISCQELLPLNMSNFHGAGRSVVLPAVDTSGWPELIPNDVSVALVDERLEMVSRWTSAIATILQFDPDLILCVGPYSPITSALYSFRPVVALPTNAVSFLGSADVWLRGSDHKISDSEMTWDHEFPIPLAHFHPFRIHKNKNKRSLTRKEVGIDPSALVLVTVGFRLKNEILGIWANQMLDTLTQFDKLVWVIIGSETPSALEHAPHGKVINLGVRDDVSSIMQLCDIYVNPPRMGGGFSVLEAMSSGVATLAFSNTDGGEKIGTYAASDQPMYFSQLIELITNQEKRAAIGMRMQKRFIENYDTESSGPSLMNACKVAIVQAGMRLKDPF